MRFGYCSQIMTTIGMHYDVIAGRETEFKDGFLKVIDHLKTVPGHVDSHLFEDVAMPGSFLILSNWQTKQDFEGFIHSDTFRQVTNWGKAEILRGRPRHKVYLSE
jgi:heme-degrading monooxygenase HmoA